MMAMPEVKPVGAVSGPAWDENTTIFADPQLGSEVHVGEYWIWVMSDGSPLLHARRHGRGMVITGHPDSGLLTAKEVGHFITWLQKQLPAMREAEQDHTWVDSDTPPSYDDVPRSGEYWEYAEYGTSYQIHQSSSSEGSHGLKIQRSEPKPQRYAPDEDHPCGAIGLEYEDGTLRRCYLDAGHDGWHAATAPPYRDRYPAIQWAPR